MWLSFLPLTPAEHWASSQQSFRPIVWTLRIHLECEMTPVYWKIKYKTKGRIGIFWPLWIPEFLTFSILGHLKLGRRGWVLDARNLQIKKEYMFSTNRPPNIQQLCEDFIFVLFSREGERWCVLVRAQVQEQEWERELFHLPFHSSNTHNRQGLARLKEEAQHGIQVSHMGGSNPWPWAINRSLPGAHTGNWSTNRGARTWPRHAHRDAGVWSSNSNHCTTHLPQHNRFQLWWRKMTLWNWNVYKWLP